MEVQLTLDDFRLPMFVVKGFLPRFPCLKMPPVMDIVIVSTVVHDVIIGGATQVNIIHFHVMECLHLKLNRMGTHSIFHTSADSILEGVIEGILVDVGWVQILTTFHFLRVPDPNNSYSLFHGMPFLKGVKAKLHVNDKGSLEVKILG